jgi:carbon-monoxide dehydrogenase medium subunit
VIRGLTGVRVVDMRGFHRGPYETAVGAAEMLIEIRVPLRPNTGSAYLKVDRRVGDWAVVAAGASIEIVDGRVAGAGLALAAVGGDITVAAAEASLIGRPPSEAAFARAAELASSACEPVTDQRGSADYKRHVVGVLTERVLRRATERALLMKEE